VFTLFFGAGTIGLALLVPLAGGIVEVVLSIAAIAGGALFAPIIWSLYSKRQTATSVVTTTIIALSVSLFFKVIAPALIGLKFTRSMETLLGVGLPLFVLAMFEYYYYTSGKEAPEALLFQNAGAARETESPAHVAAASQNVFGITVIAVAAAAVGLGIFALGLASEYNQVVMVVGSIIFILAATGFFRIRLSVARAKN
jgi:solute:Na+ symporter, SSS family